MAVVPAEATRTNDTLERCSSVLHSTVLCDGTALSFALQDDT